VTSQTSTPEDLPSPRAALASHGPEADSLLDEVRASMATLSGLLAHAGDLGATVTTAIRSALQEVEGRLDKKQLKVVVVGEEQAGKSTFLDALLGERLLGMSKTPPSTVTSVRRGKERGYRVRFGSGATEDFARRVPDRTPEIVQRISEAETAGVEAKHNSYVAAADVASASDSLEKAEASLTNAFHAFETAREEAAQVSDQLAAKERSRESLAVEAEEGAAALPLVVRQRPSWWALWLWVAKLVVMLFTWRAWRAHRALSRQFKSTEAEITRLRAETTRAAESCAKAEAELAAANPLVEEARKALAASQDVLNETAALRDELEFEAAQHRRDLERAREERQQRFLTEVRALSDAEVRGKDVVDLEIEYPARFLPDDVIIIDTPGITAKNASARDHAWRVINEQADVCMLVSELERAVSGATKSFLQQLRDAVLHAILVLTKMDEAYTEATRKGDSDPWEQVELARRIGTRRFAREVGRDPNTVLSVAVAAEEALREGAQAEPARRRFEAEIAKLFVLLRQERALILGAWSAGIVRRCIGGVAEAEKRAEHSYRERIAALEAQRIPGPDRFRTEQMDAAEPAVAAAAARVVAAGLDVMRGSAGLARVQCAQRIAACTTKEELRALAPQLTSAIVEALSRGREEVRAHLDVQADRAVRDIEVGAFQALRERYQLLHEVTRVSTSPTHVEAAIAEPGKTPDLAPAVDQAVRSFDRLRVGFGVGGAAAGAAVGTLILPGIGSAAGALFGALATFARTPGALRRDCTAVTNECIAGLERVHIESITSLEPAVAKTIRASLEQSIDEALSRFGRWIAEPLEAERAAIEGEREKLRHLQTLHERLQHHDARLESLMQAAADASIGLCK
jgi:GTP-binding protein EngB required for normal cell division